MSFTRLELEQIRNARTYDDSLSGGAGAESGVDHASDFNYVISQIRRILGETNWFDAPADDLSTLDSRLTTAESDIFTNAGNISTNASNISANSSAIADNDTDIAGLRSFVGQSGVEAPGYASTYFITQGNDLETAIATLDARLYTASGTLAIAGADTWTQVFNNGSGILDASAYDAVVNLGAGKSWNLKDSGGDILHLASDTEHLLRRVGRRETYVPDAHLSAGDPITIPNSASYTTGDPKYRNLQVYVGGALWLPGSGISSGDENYNDYREASATTIVPNWKIHKGSVVQFRIFG